VTEKVIDEPDRYVVAQSYRASPGLVPRNKSSTLSARPVEALLLTSGGECFNAGRIGREQLQDYTPRKQEALEVTGRWLSSNLAHEPTEFWVN
jgi:hypothetical protein